MSCGNATRCILCRFVITNAFKIHRNYVPQQRQALSILKPVYAWNRQFSSANLLKADEGDDSVSGVKDSKMTFPDGKKENKDTKNDTKDEDSSSSSSDSSDSDSDSDKQAKQVPKSPAATAQKSSIRASLQRDRVMNKFAKLPSSENMKNKEYREGFLRFQKAKFEFNKRKDKQDNRPDQLTSKVSQDDKFNNRRRDQSNDRPDKRKQNGRVDVKVPPLAEILNGKQHFGIFTEKDYKNAKEPIRTLFDTVAQEEYDEAYKQNPLSAMEEQLQWTRDGKFWHFPIDNEQGWEEEKECSFQDHVFFNEQLKDFPKKGPVRHFMELVTNALASNHHLSVKEKHETIEWYKDYFMQHEEVLMEKYGEGGAIKQEQKL